MKNMKRMLSIALVLVLGLGVFGVAAGASATNTLWQEIINVIGEEVIVAAFADVFSSDDMVEVVRLAFLSGLPGNAMPQDFIERAVNTLIAALPDDAPEGFAERIAAEVDGELASLVLQMLFPTPRWVLRSHTVIN